MSKCIARIKYTVFLHVGVFLRKQHKLNLMFYILLFCAIIKITFILFEGEAYTKKNKLNQIF